jgi:putative FmdB family regulatory protein
MQPHTEQRADREIRETVVARCRPPGVPFRAMATYEYVCLACEHLFEERRPMGTGSVTTALACPSCGSERVRRRFSFSAAVGGTSSGPAASGGCGCGSCVCGAG